MSVKIGIPRALAYYAYYPFWKEFFNSLGIQTVVSGATTKKTLDEGVKEAVTDACVPIKLFHGHVIDLIDKKVDYIFIPRLVSVNKEENVTFCPKFLGLPDMIRVSIKNLPPLIDERVDLKKGKKELLKICLRIGKRLKVGYLTSFKAYTKAVKAQKYFRQLLDKQLTPLEAINIIEGKEYSVNHDESKYRFAVLGFPYAVYDKFVNVDVISRLRQLGIKVLTAEMIPSEKLLQQASKIPKNLFWNFSNQVLRAALYYLDHDKIDGIIHITAFGCGPDAMVDKMIELEAKQRGRIPFMSITIDEHTGEAGLMTRIEAFADMFAFRRELS